MQAVLSKSNVFCSVSRINLPHCPGLLFVPFCLSLASSRELSSDQTRFSPSLSRDTSLKSTAKLPLEETSSKFSANRAATRS